MRRKGKKDIFQLSDGHSLTVRELKAIHAMRDTRGYQNLGVSSNSTR